jgi:hypothetical protein
MPLSFTLFLQHFFGQKNKTEEPAVFIDSNLIAEMQLNISTQMKLNL